MEAKIKNAVSHVLIHLMKGVLYKEEKPNEWHTLMDEIPFIKDHFSMLNLEVHIAQDEGYAWLSNIEDDEDENHGLPKMVRRYPLSYPMSLVLALLRKRMAENDMRNNESRLIVESADVWNMIKVFWPSGSNEVKSQREVEKILVKINKDLGFIRLLKGETQKYEVRRILKAFVDAQWVKNLNERLGQYIQMGEDEREAGREGKMINGGVEE